MRGTGGSLCWQLFQQLVSERNLNLATFDAVGFDVPRSWYAGLAIKRKAFRKLSLNDVKEHTCYNLILNLTTKHHFPLKE